MILASVRKDMLLLASDRGAVLSLFLLPLIFMGVFGAIFQEGNGGSGSFTVAVYASEQANTAADTVAAGLEANPATEVLQLKSVDAVRAAVKNDEAAVGLVLPDDFSPMTGKPALLLVDSRASPPERAALEGALSRIMADGLYGTGTSTLFRVEAAEVGESSELSSGFQVSVPGNAVLFCFFLAMTVALSFMEDRRTGVLRRLLSSPAPKWSLLLSKLVPFFLIGIVQMVFLFGMGVLAFGLDLGTNYLGLLLLTLSIVLCAVTLGFLMASFGGTEKQVGGIGSIILLVMGLLGGAMVPRMVMPSLMKTIGFITPQAWALDGYHVLLVSSQSDVSSVLVEVAAILGFAGVFAGIALLRFRFE
jgi:ABC-2 type transport system permease protein